MSRFGESYVACGQLTKREARKSETNSVYGSNVMLEFESEAAYQAKLSELREQGESVQ